MIIEGLANKNKWQQMDMFVRKYRILNRTESLKNYAASMSVVPMLRDSVLKNAEETKLQILKAMVGGGATLGSDGKHLSSIARFCKTNANDNLKFTTSLVKVLLKSQMLIHVYKYNDIFGRKNLRIFCICKCKRF